VTTRSRFPPPPPPSLPKQAPWTDAEDSLDALNGIGAGVQGVIAAIKALGGGGGGGVTPPFYGLYIYEDYGLAADGNNTTLHDTKKSWLPNLWRGHTVFVVINSILYVSVIASNDASNLTFAALPTGVQVQPDSAYWIQTPMTHTIFVPPTAIYTKDIRLIETDTTPVQDITLSQRVAIKVKSTLDQAVTVQLIGDFFNPMDTPTNINGPFVVPIGSVTPSSVEIGLAPGDWQPYLAVQLSTLVAPTVGTVSVWLAGQD
jgi:hypothetical protein